MEKHRRLAAWRLAKELAVAVYRVTARFPGPDVYGLSAQMRRAAVSVSSNIAEGNARLGRREFRRFLGMALGSLAELDSLLEVAEGVGLLTAASREPIERLKDETSRVTFGLQRSLRDP